MSAPQAAIQELAVNPVTLEVVRNALIAIVNEMTSNLTRTSYSPIISEIKDFGVGFVDARARSIAQTLAGLPVFLADLGPPIADSLALHGPEGLEPGDVLLSNYSGVNGQHLNNVVAHSPIFVAGELLAFPAVRAHWIDVGGKVSGSLAHDSREIFEEGLQLRSVKVYRRGLPDQDIVRIIRHNVRFPDLILGDMRAQISACRLGEKRFTELVARYGKETVFACIQRIWDEAELLTRRAVEAIPDGIFMAETFLDNDGVNLRQPIPLKVRVIVEGSEMTVDFSEMPRQVSGPYNSRGAVGAARVAFKCLTCPMLPANDGCFRNLKVVAPEGTILSADENAAMGWWMMPIVSVIDLILKALHPAIPEQVTAGHYANISGAMFMGVNPRSGRRFHIMDPEIGGWGATSKHDGMNAVVSLNQGDVHNLPVETEETTYPVRVREFRLRQDSGGPGRFRGGLGVVRATEALAPCEYMGQYERVQAPPWGLAGGGEGKVNRVTLRRHPEAAEEELALKLVNYPLQPQHVVTLSSPGGGGYGPAWERDVESVRRDVLDGYVSREQARDDYGVVLRDGTLEVDEEATRARRRHLGGRDQPAAA
ncbi:MAG: hydantoinase B/oxoprolinase family protein [Candidatus Tectomicrobia bacterium]|nr:hydantoinase B/oxoprolinase family protein [Candidatus Tectomicrobia bacterium]